MPVGFHLMYGGSIVHTDHVLSARFFTTCEYASLMKERPRMSSMANVTKIIKVTISSDDRNPMNCEAKPDEQSELLSRSS
eukprot:5575537-Prymnesium_polylepis.2